jgi:hypothetical protein
MKKLLYAALMLSAMFGSSAARAVDGCKVLLCLAGNWQNFATCRPDVEAAMREVDEGRGLPSCDESGAGNFARVDTAYFDPCPDGTTPLAAGVAAAQIASTESGYSDPVVGIGDGANWVPTQDVPQAQQVCVGTQTGTFAIQVGAGQDANTEFVNLYDRVVVMDMYTPPRVIDVFLNNALYRRVRW